MLKTFLNKFFFFSLLNYLPGIARQKMPADKQATKEAINLYNNLKRLFDKGFMFGHQDDLAYGVGWKYDPSASSAGRSDIKDVYVFGWKKAGGEFEGYVPYKGHQSNTDFIRFL